MATQAEKFKAKNLEEAIISAFLNYPNMVSEAHSNLPEEVFSDPILKGIYSDILISYVHTNSNNLHRSLLGHYKHNLEKVALLEKIKQTGKFEISNIQYYIQIIKQKYLSRKLIMLTSMYNNLALEDKTCVFELIEKLKSDIYFLEKSM